MDHHLQISFDPKIIMVNQYGKESLQVDPTVNLRESSKKIWHSHTQNTGTTSFISTDYRERISHWQTYLE